MPRTSHPNRSWKAGFLCALTLSAGCSLLPTKKLNPAATKLDSYAADPDNVDPRSLPPNAKISKPKPTKPTAEILVDFAQVQFSLEHYDVAENMYNQALKLNNKYLPAYVGLSQVYLKQERPEKALEILTKVPKKSRNDPMILNEMAVVHCKRKDYRAAEELFRQALDLDPENELFITNLAGVKAVTGNYDEAYRLYASKVGPAEARYRVAGVLYQQGNLADSQRQLELALKSNPKHEKSAAMLVELHGGRRPGEGVPSAPGAAATARAPVTGAAATPEVKPAGFFATPR